MAQQAEEVEPDLSHIHWSWPEAIAANPSKSLATADLAMDYFAYSPFFDTKSNNSVLRTQRRVDNPLYGHQEEKIELTAFRSGFEYVVAHSQPPALFLIHRRDVKPDGSREAISAAYFILHDKVYPTPTIYDVVATRLRNATHLVAASFTTLSALHPPANPRAPSVWRSLPPTAKAPTVADAATAAETAADASYGDGDVTMHAPRPAPGIASTVPAPSAHKPSSSAPAPSPHQPDFALFNALASTRSALPDLSDLARSPPPGRDPAEELRVIEAALLGTQGTSSAAVRQASSARGSSAAPRTLSGMPQGTRIGVGGSPFVSFAGSPGRGAGSVLGSTVVAGSPLAGVWSPAAR